MENSELIHGYQELKLNSWQEFFSPFLNNKITGGFVLRGQKDSSFKLLSNIDRIDMSDNFVTKQKKICKHLSIFKSNVRGKISSLPLNDDEWWALGQHYGLLTPLLDWTESPFIALYFAMNEEVDNDIKFRSVYALNPEAIKEISRKIEREHKPEDFGVQLELYDTDPEYWDTYFNLIKQPPIIKLISPFTNNNVRLLSQKGIFTFNPTGECIRNWIKQNTAENDSRQILIKILIPNIDNDKCVEALDHMNINQTTIFPDINGAAKYSNHKFKQGIKIL